MKTKKYRIDRTTQIELPAKLSEKEANKRIKKFIISLNNRQYSGINGLQY